MTRFMNPNPGTHGENRVCGRWTLESRAGTGGHASGRMWARAVSVVMMRMTGRIPVSREASLASCASWMKSCSCCGKDCKQRHGRSRCRTVKCCVLCVVCCVFLCFCVCGWGGGGKGSGVEGVGKGWWWWCGPVCLTYVSLHIRPRNAPDYGGRVPVDTTPGPAPVCRALKNSHSPRQSTATVGGWGWEWGWGWGEGMEIVPPHQFQQFPQTII